MTRLPFPMVSVYAAIGGSLCARLAAGNIIHCSPMGVFISAMAARLEFRIIIYAQAQSMVGGGGGGYCLEATGGLYVESAVAFLLSSGYIGIIQWDPGRLEFGNGGERGDAHSTRRAVLKVVVRRLCYEFRDDSRTREDVILFLCRHSGQRCCFKVVFSLKDTLGSWV